MNFAKTKNLIMYSLLFNISLAMAQVVDYVHNSILIKVDQSTLTNIDMQSIAQGITGIRQIDSLNFRYGVNSLQQQFPNLKYKEFNGQPVTLDGWFYVNFSSEVNVQEIAQQYRAFSGIIRAEPIAIVQIEMNSNDIGNQWHLNQNNDKDIDAPEAWDYETGDAQIIVAVMDTGVRWWHKDLAGAVADNTGRNTIIGNIWINSDELANTNSSFDEDGNGFNDDWMGWDFVTGSPQYYAWSGEDYDTEDNDPRDFNGHGTHCAGNVGEINNNNLGGGSAAGGWGESNGSGNGVKIMCLRIGWNDKFLGFLYETGYVRMDFAANAFRYAADNGAKIASCSWGSSDLSNLGDAIDYFLYGSDNPLPQDPKLRLIFKAAGNSNTTASDFMIDRSDIITVAATDENDSRASFSNYGSNVDISAPGNNIYSTYHDHNNESVDDYEIISGTSMSTPITASVAGLIWSHNLSLTASQVEQMLYDSADPLLDTGIGAGRVNASAAVILSDQSLPVELSTFGVEVIDDHVLLSWQTQSEIENLGFNILRSSEENGRYLEIASFRNRNELRGLGNSSQGKKYSYNDFSVSEGSTYWYKIEDIDINGVKKTHGPVSVTLNTFNILPNQFNLSPNFPNPFNPTTTFTIKVPIGIANELRGQVIIYDLLGRRMRTIYDGYLAGGKHDFNWDGKDQTGSDAPTGTYIYSFISQPFSQARKMLLIR